MKKKTLVVGASTNPARYSFLAAGLLHKYGYETVLFGNRKGEVNGNEIFTDWPKDEKIDTITLYVSAKNQENLVADILNSGTRRIIFNPGTENIALEEIATKKGILTERACTLVLLNTQQYDD